MNRGAGVIEVWKEMKQKGVWVLKPNFTFFTNC